MRRIGPDSGCSQASRPRSTSKLASDGGHSGPNAPGSGALSGALTCAAIGCDARSDRGPSCGVTHAATSDVITTSRLRLRRRDFQRLTESARSFASRHSSEHSINTDAPAACA